MTERVSVIIPNWNGARFLPACLESLRRQTFRDFVAYVVDNGSVDESLALLARDFPEVVVVAIPENRGFSAAVNAGVAASQGQYVAALNNDTECDARWLEELVRAMELHPETGFFASKVLSFDDRQVIDSFGDGYTRAGLAFKIGSLERDDGRFDQMLEVFSACAAASIYRRAMLDDIGGFDEDFFCYMEDVDLGLRARLAGYRCLAVPGAKVFHIGAASSGGGPSEFSVRMTTKNLYNVMLKNMPLSLLALMLPVTLAAQAWLVTRALVHPAGSRLRPQLAGYWQGLAAAARQAPKMIRKRRALRTMRRIPRARLVELIRLSERQRRLGAP
jgi:GT2 family glycosyltransferase